jgi:hypothetical protein
VQVALRGSSASAVTAGILLLTHAKRLGHPIKVVIEGRVEEAARVEGPALVHSPVLWGCGVGRVPKSNGLVCMPGPAIAPLLVSLELGGLSDWFELDRAGSGVHPSTSAVVRLCRHPDPQGQNLGRVLRGALAAIGCPAEPALLDLLFGAPIQPLERVALALRAGRAMTGDPGLPFTRLIRSGITDIPDPLPTPLIDSELQSARQDGRLDRVLARLQPGIQVAVLDWLNGVEDLKEDFGMTSLVCSIAEVGSHLVTLPMAGMLPTLSPESEAIAGHLGPAIGTAVGADCAMATLIQTFKFLGGNFVDHSPFAVNIAGDPPPAGRQERWAWLCQSAYLAKEEADELWRKLVDPLQ